MLFSLHHITEITLLAVVQMSQFNKLISPLNSVIILFFQSCILSLAFSSHPPSTRSFISSSSYFRFTPSAIPNSARTLISFSLENYSGYNGVGHIRPLPHQSPQNNVRVRATEWKCQWRLRRSIRSLGAGVIGSCRLPSCGVLGSDLWSS